MSTDTQPARSGRVARLATVVETARLSPHMIRVVLGGAGLAGFEAGAFSDHYVKLQLPAPGARYRAPFDPEAVKASSPREHWPRTRTYSVRDWDAEQGRLTIDFVVHGSEGIAGPWAAAARPGDTVQLSGPGGAYLPDRAADWHLLAGDASVLPAIAASLGRIPAGVPTIVLAEVDGPEEELELATAGHLSLHWLHRSAEPGAEPQLLVDALAALELPSGDGQAFVHGEASSVRAARRHLLVDRGLPAHRLSASGYWKCRRDEEGWREDKREWNRLAEQDVA